MRWPSPKTGDERKTRWFVLLPVECSNGETVWLEPVIEVERFDGFMGLWRTQSLMPERAPRREPAEPPRTLVHNHGPSGTPGLSCRETRVDGKLVGDCLRESPQHGAER